jgi:serine/threonine protein kinase/Flp pilus assembly protein TadD
MAEVIDFAKTAIGILEMTTMEAAWDTRAYEPILLNDPQVSGYRLIARRGRGGVAEVWEAVSPGSHRVALKLVQLSTDLRSGELRALKITRGICHPGLLTVHGAWQVESLLVISMELADRSLWDRFVEANGQGLRGIPRGELLGYLGPVADAIDYLNGSRHTIEGRQGVGIQHRDLKPQNLLLFGDRAKVGDFGMARVMEGHVIDHSGPCTVPYAAPEYFSGRTARQSDQYALAVTYCHLRGGRFPFPGSTAQMAIGHTSNAPDLDGLSEPERPVVARAMAKRPEDRWPDCRSFVDALEVLGSAGEWSIPDALPREQRGLWPRRDSAGESSTPGLDPAQTDFIPVDSSELESSYNGTAAAGIVPAFRLGPYQLALISRIGTWIFDHLPRHRHQRQDRLALGWPADTDASPRASGRAAVRRDWSVRLERIRRLVAVRMDRMRQIGHRAAHRAGVHPEWLGIGSIAALVVSCLVLGNLAWTSQDQRRRAEPFNGVAVLETPSSHRRHATAGGSYETGITPGPARERPIVAATPEPLAIPPAPPVPKRTRRTPGDWPKPKEVVPAGRHVSAEPKESSPTTREVAAKRPRAPAGTNPIESELKSTSAPLQQPGSIPRVSTTVSPAPHQAGANQGMAEVKAASTVGSEVEEAPTWMNVLPPPPATIAYKRGMAAFFTGSFDRAIADFNEALRTDPNLFGARFYRGMVHALARRSQEALADYAAAIQLQPNHPAPYLERAKVYIDLGAESLALSDYTEAIRLNPDAEAHLARAHLHHEMGSYDQALTDCDHALRLRPGDPAAFYLRGLTHYHSGDYSGAVADLTEVLRCDPQDARAYRIRGDAHARLGNHADAVADHAAFERSSRPAVKRVPDTPGVPAVEGGPGAGRGQGP